MTKHKKPKIDYSDIPETDADFWKNAEVHCLKRNKSLTIRIDPEVLAWFQAKGKAIKQKLTLGYLNIDKFKAFMVRFIVIYESKFITSIRTRRDISESCVS